MNKTYRTINATHHPYYEAIAHKLACKDEMESATTQAAVDTAVTVYRLKLYAHPGRFLAPHNPSKPRYATPEQLARLAHITAKIEALQATVAEFEAMVKSGRDGC